MILESGKQISIPISTLILIFLLSFSMSDCAQLDYHLEKKVPLPSTIDIAKNNITNIVALKAGQIAVVSGSLPNVNVTVFTGSDYDQPIFSVNQSGVVSKPRFDGKYTINFNKGYFTYLKNYGRSKTYSQLNITTQSVINGRQKTQFSESKKCPTITTHSSFYSSISSITIGQQSKCNFYSAGYLSRPKQGYTFYAGKHSLFLLAYQALIGNFTQEAQRQKDQNLYTGVDGVYKQAGPETPEEFKAVVKLGDFGMYRLIRKVGAEGLSNFAYQLYNPMRNMYLTGWQQGVSFHQNYIYRWQNTTPPTINQQWSDTNQGLPGLTLCISSNESLIIQEQGNKIHIFNVNKTDNYKIQKVYEHTFANVQSIIQGRIDRDNQYLLFNAYTISQEADVTTFCKMDLETKDVLCFEDVAGVDHAMGRDRGGEGRHVPGKRRQSWQFQADLNGYLKLVQSKTEASAGKTNRLSEQSICKQWAIYSDYRSFVGLCLNKTSNLFQLRLYSTQTLTLQKSQPIYIGDLPSVKQIRMIKNEYKQEYDQSISDRPMFLLVFKLDNNVDNDNAVTVRYIVQNGQFIRHNVPSYQFSFFNLYAYGNNIVSLKLVNGSNMLRFYDFTSFKILEEIFYEGGSIRGKFYFKAYRNIFMLQQQQGLRATQIYDLKNIPGQQNFRRGTIFYGYLPFRSIIFPKTNIHYFYRGSGIVEGPIKQIINIETVPIKQYRRLQIDTNESKINVLKFLKANPLIVGRQCDIVFYIVDNRWLYKFEDCGSDRKTQRLALTVPASGNIEYQQIYQSDSKQSIILKSTHTFSSHHHLILQCHPIETPHKLQWYQNKTSQAQQMLFTNYIEDIYGTGVLKLFKSKAIYQPIEDISNASYYYLIQFQDVNVQEHCIGFVGQLQDKGGVDAAIYYYQVNNVGDIRAGGKEKGIGFSAVQVKGEVAKVLEITADCKHIATYTDKGSVLVWSIQQNPSLKLNITRQNIEKISFSGDSKIAIQMLDTLQIIQISTSLTLKQHPTINIQSKKTAFSPDGQVYASITDTLTVEISSTATNQLIRTFKVPQDNTTKEQSIFDLSFSDDNKLFVTVSNSYVYILTQLPCPNPFINTNGVCTCRANQKQVGNTCSCVDRYVLKDGICSCDLSQYVYENQQCICSKNATEVEGKCRCLNNFVQKGAYCSCPNSFQFNSQKMTCECPFGFVDKQECVECSFPCSTCSNSPSNCNSYTATFYILVIGGGLVIIAVVVVVIFVLRKMKMKRRDKGSELLREEVEKA